MIFEVYKMQNNLSNIARKLFAACLLASPLSAAAVDYDVLGGSFFMSNGVTPSPVPITGMGTEAPVPGFPLVGKFSDNSFPADFSCSDYGASTSQVTQCNTASTNGPDVSASRSGLSTFTFFGVPVFLYFAQTGIDGNAVAHPVPTIDLINLTADFGSFYANWNGTEFNQGSIDPANLKTGDTDSTNATIVDNADGSYTVNWVSLIEGGPFDQFVGTWTMHICPSPCTLTDLAIAPTLEATQAAAVTRTLVKGAASDATVTFDSNFNSAGITFDWSLTDDSLDLGATVTTSVLTIAQADIDAAALGVHRIVVEVTDTNVTPNAKALGELLVRIVAAGADPDVDNDGIPDSADSITDVTQLQSDSTTEIAYIMTTSAGSLKQGSTAFCAGNTSAEVTVADITNGGGIGCAATTNAVDVTGPTVVTGIGGYFDFEVHGLTRGQSVDVVIPLKVAIPVNAGYRKYDAFSGWTPFDQSGGDTVMSAAGAPGTCPSAASAEWVSGLVQGYNCMKLSITDGGLNDNATGADGIIKDPGSISSNPDIDTSLLDLGGSLSWPVLTALATWIGLVRRKARHIS